MSEQNYNIEHDLISMCSREQTPSGNVNFRIKTKLRKALYYLWIPNNNRKEQNMTFQVPASCIHAELCVRSFALIDSSGTMPCLQCFPLQIREEKDMPRTLEYRPLAS